MNEYVMRVTFGVQYAREPHPTLEFAHPDGWLEVVVRDAPPAAAHALAQREAFAVTGGQHAFDYGPQTWDPKWHPLGVLARLTYDAESDTRDLEVFRTFRQSMVDIERSV